jgi:hypothetical protein
VIKARIFSDTDLPKFGVFRNMSYVWQERPTPDMRTWKVYIVHESHKHRQLKEGAQFVGGSHPEIHLVRATKMRIAGTKRVDTFAFGVCTDDCPSGHCGYQ